MKMLEESVPQCGQCRVSLSWRSGIPWGSCRVGWGRHLGRSRAEPDSSERARCFHHYGKNLLVPLCPEKHWRRKCPLELTSRLNIKTAPSQGQENNRNERKGPFVSPALTLDVKVPQKAAVPPRGPVPKPQRAGETGPGAGAQWCFSSTIIIPVLPPPSPCGRCCPRNVRTHGPCSRTARGMLSRGLQGR